MPDYQNGKIYTIRCRTDNTKIYVGSTTTTLCKRLTEHRHASKSERNIKMWYKDIEDWEDWYIELYEDFPCDRKEQLCKREGEIIREIGNLNKRIEGRTASEWGKDNPEKKRASCKKYHESHRDERLEYKKEYREANKEKIAEYRANYWLNVQVANKDEINQKQRENYANNKDEINRKRREIRTMKQNT